MRKEKVSAKIGGVLTVITPRAVQKSMVGIFRSLLSYFMGEIINSSGGKRKETEPRKTRPHSLSGHHAHNLTFGEVPQGGT